MFIIISLILPWRCHRSVWKDHNIYQIQHWSKGRFGCLLVALCRITSWILPWSSWQRRTVIRLTCCAWHWSSEKVNFFSMRTLSATSHNKKTLLHPSLLQTCLLWIVFKTVIKEFIPLASPVTGNLRLKTSLYFYSCPGCLCSCFCLLYFSLVQHGAWW